MTERENMLAFLERRDCEYVPETACFTGPDIGAIVHADIAVCERPMFKSGYDIFGVHWTEAVPASHYTQGQPPIIEDVEDWREQVRFPKVERFDWEVCRRSAAALDRENKVVAVTTLTGPFERATCLTAFEDCLVNAISEPEAFSGLIGAIADYKIALIDRIWAAARPDVINFHDDWGTAKSTFMSPALWRETIKPHIKRIYDAIHGHGMLVCQHSCGAIAALVPDMIEMGCDIWEAQRDANDIPALQAQYGEDIRIVTAPPREIMERIAAAGRIKPWVSAGFEPYAAVPAFLYE